MILQNYTYKVVSVNKILDGDTVDLTVRLGFSMSISHRFRLVAYDAPETYRPLNNAEHEAGIKVKEYLAFLLEKHKKALFVKSKTMGIYGRYEGELFTEEGNSINNMVLAKMNQEGWTKEMTRGSRDFTEGAD